jgi:hypothetical protein
LQLSLKGNQLLEVITIPLINGACAYVLTASLDWLFFSFISIKQYAIFQLQLLNDISALFNYSQVDVTWLLYTLQCKAGCHLHAYN